jgi:ubiquinone/menaquinone biosynthesis C-methylase UbiE
MPFEEGTFDCGYMMHVGMNIENKTKLFNEIFRVLRPGSSFGIYDVMRVSGDEIVYPVPWAASETTSFVASSEQYKDALGNAGFEISNECNRRDFALNFFNKLREQAKENGGPPALGLHNIMREETVDRINNMIENISADIIAPIELIVKKY